MSAPGPAGSSDRPGLVILGFSRTPIGSLGGSLSSFSAPALGGLALARALENSGVPAAAVEACHMGHVLSAGAGQAPARQAASAAGLGPAVVTSCVNKVCASGMAAVLNACMELQLRRRACVAAGGMESASACPYYVREARFGKRLGDCVFVDGLVADGLVEPADGTHMGMHAELCAKTYGFSRE